MSKTFTFDPSLGAVDTATKRCSGEGCGRPMVSRRRLKQIPKAERGDLIAHAAAGVCTTCDGKARRKAAMPKTRTLKVVTRSAKQKAADEARTAERDYLMGEWAHLRSFGVSREEAAPRLGVSVRTLEKYDQALLTHHTQEDA